MLVVDGPNGTTDMSSDSTVTTVTPQSQDEPIDITGSTTFSFDYSPYEDSDTDAEEVVDHWRRLDPEIPRPAPSAFPFTGNPGFKIPTANLKDPVDYFNLFFDDPVVQYIVSETNRTADHFLQTEQQSARAQKWYETNDKEFRIFLAILLYQGIVKKPKEEWYWSRRPCLSTPIVGELMPYRRFRNLNLFLYSSGNETCDSALDPHPLINKIYQVCNLLCNKFQDAYVPEREITIDELFSPSKGRPCYTPAEKDRLGIRIYELCESRSGYVWNMMICTGKDTPFEYNGKKYDTATRYVITLVKDILNKGYCLSVDNSYISPELTEFLISHKTDIYETVRPSKKKLPTFSNTENVAIGESVAFQKGKLRVSEWQGKEPECILSSLQYDEMIGSSSSQTAPERQDDVHVANFDYSDLYASCYPETGKQPKEHYKKIFRHLLNQAVWNSFVLYRKTGGTTKLLEFRLQLLEELIKHNKESNMHHRIPGTLPESCLRLTERHFPSLVPQRGRKSNPCRKCVVCANLMDENGKRKRKESRYECRKCDRGLCVTPCFEIYHTVEEL